MVKYINVFFITNVLLMSSVTFAEKSSIGDYYRQSNSSTNHTMQGFHTPPTDITIINATFFPIHVMIPNTHIYDDVVYPGANEHIRHNYRYAPTQLVIKDPYSNVFFDQEVCRLAVVAVMGAPGSYQINVDNEYCW